MAPRKASDEKSALILQAATKVLTRHGYARTTIKEVAAEAGVSRGLLHYYFKSKEEMLFMVVRDSVTSSLQMMEGILSQSRTPAEMAANLCQAMRQFLTQSPDLISIMFESWSLARQSQSARAELENLYHLFHQSLSQELYKAIQRGMLKPSASVMVMAAVLTMFLDGMCFDLMVISDLREDQGFWQASQKALQAMLESF